MKGVVMAGGEGTRLRPLTSNQPKPMVPICGKPCIEHIVELLAAYKVEDIVITLAFLPQAIRGYLGDGSSLGVRLEYSVEQSPLGTAGSVKNAEDLLDETFVVISGDALCDFDLDRIVAFHRERGSLATIALKSVDNPLEFGVVICDEEGRIERFLEKPSWGQVFSDTINTGVYVLEPEVLRWVPAGEPFDFSKQLFPLLLEAGKPMYGFTTPEEWYWQDIGTLDQYRQANADVLDGRCHVSLSGMPLKGNIWLGEGVALPPVDVIEGPAFLGNYVRVEEGARIGPYSVLGPNASVRRGATVERSVLDGGCYVAGGATVSGAILGRNCDVRAHARVSEGAAIGDECSIGEESVIAPGVRVYPYKTIEPGAQVVQNLIWESRGTSSLFSRDGVSGIVNVDITPEVAVRLGIAFGTNLAPDARVAVSRDAHASSTMIARALVAGVTSTGVDVIDMRVAPPALTRHEIKDQRLAGGVHVRAGLRDSDTVEILLFEELGLLASDALRRSVERAYTRQEYRRSSHGDMGALGYPTGAVERYVGDLCAAVDAERIRSRGFKLVIDYGFAPASLVLPAVLNALGVEVIALNAFDERGLTGELPVADGATDHDQLRRLVAAAGADLAVALDPAAERLTLYDEHGRPVPHDQVLLLMVSLAVRRELAGAIAVPVSVSRQVDALVEGSDIEVRRTAASAGAISAAASGTGVLFAGADRGGLAFGAFLAAYDASAALCRLLEWLAPEATPVSQLVAELPVSTLVHDQTPCPWAAKGAVMRRLIEEAKGRESESVDGLMVREPNGWVQLLPDPDRPLFHVFAEAADARGSRRLADAYLAQIGEIVSEFAATR